MKGRFFSQLIIALIITACASFQTQHQKIGAACISADSALASLTAAKTAGRISQGELLKAIDIYGTTVPFCQPVATSLSAVDYAALIRAVGELTARSAANEPR